MASAALADFLALGDFLNRPATFHLEEYKRNYDEMGFFNPVSRAGVMVTDGGDISIRNPKGFFFIDGDTGKAFLGAATTIDGGLSLLTGNGGFSIDAAPLASWAYTALPLMYPTTLVATTLGNPLTGLPAIPLHTDPAPDGHVHTLLRLQPRPLFGRSQSYRMEQYVAQLKEVLKG